MNHQVSFLWIHTCRESLSFSKSSSRSIFCCSWAFLKSTRRFTSTIKKRELMFLAVPLWCWVFIYGLKSYLSWYGRAPHATLPWWCYACLWAPEWRPGGWLLSPPSNTHTHHTLVTDQISLKLTQHRHISHDAFLSPAPVAEFSAPPSLTDAPPSGVLPPLSDTS